MTTCAADNGSALDCQPCCSAPATKLVTMHLHTGRTYTDPLCDRHARLRAWNDGAPQDHVRTELIEDAGVAWTPPTHCPACGVPLTPTNRLRVHVGGWSCGHGPHDR